MALLEIEELGKDFAVGFRRRAVTAIASFSLSLEGGGTCFVVGPNGAGKTTLFNILLGFLSPSRGRVSLFGRSPRDMTVRERLGYVPESLAFDPYVTGKAALWRSDCLSRREGRGREKRVERALDLVDLGSVASRPVAGYSKGMVQRLGFARALLGEPELAILDEPLSNMDPEARIRCRDSILERQGAGRTTVISTHLLDDVERLADRVVVLKAGRSLMNGNVQELLGHNVRYAVEFRASGVVDGGELRVAPDAPAAHSTGRPQHFRVDGLDSAEKDRILAVLTREGAEIVSVAAENSTFEDLYLGAMRNA